MPGKSEGDDRGERIAKVIARAGLCSRREAEARIAAGRVTVNGAKIASPALNVSTRDRIAVDGDPLPGRERTRLFLYNKPRGLVTTHADPEGRPTIFQALPKELPRLISVGRLDLGTEGLLLLTNDGGLARALELPATGWLRRYRVRAHGTVTQAALDELRDGIAVDGVQYGAIEATLDRVQGANVWLTFAIREGKNREVRNVLGALNLTVNRLIRVSFGPFQLGELADGGIEEVKTRTLRDQLGERLERLAGADFSAMLSLPLPGPVATARPPAAPQRSRGEPRPTEVKGRHGGRADAASPATVAPRPPARHRHGEAKARQPSQHPDRKSGATVRHAESKPHRGARKPGASTLHSPNRRGTEVQSPSPKRAHAPKWRPDKPRRKSPPRDRGKR